MHRMSRRSIRSGELPSYNASTWHLRGKSKKGKMPEHPGTAPAIEAARVAEILQPTAYWFST